MHRCASHMHNKLKVYTAFWQSEPLGCRRKVAKISVNRQRTPEKQKESTPNSLELGVPKTLSRRVMRNDYYVTFIHEDLFCLYRSYLISS